VSVREDPAVEGELVARLATVSGHRSIGVTDLVSLRRAYYRFIAPGVPIPPSRQARLDQGRTVHRTLGIRLANEGLLEARVRREGIVGRIDILADVPIEVKTSGSFVAPEDLARTRPDHLEQLAMYCALVGGWNGRLLTLLADDQGVHDVQALDVPFGSPVRVLEVMRDRSQRLRSAWAESRPDRLPRCPWFGRGCEFEDSKVCGCTGDEPVDPPSILDEVGPIAVRHDVQDRLRPLVVGGSNLTEAFALGRFREVLYPRRAYFDRTSPPKEPALAIPETRPLPPLPDLYGRITEALESGGPGEVARLPPRSKEPEEEVVGFRGLPVLLRTSRGWARYRPEELVARQPQYALELGLRCAVTGTDRGRVVIGFERAESDRDRVQVLELTFRSLTPFSRFLRERRRALAAAIGERNPVALPSCPNWMVDDCPYRATCGCGRPA